MSERGREAGGVTYADASALVRRLTGERVHGLCVVTDEAAERFAAPAASPGGDKPRAGKKDGARKRAVKPL